MTDTVLFWTLIAYFSLNLTLGAIFQITEHKIVQKDYTIGILIAAAFAVWLGIARWS